MSSTQSNERYPLLAPRLEPPTVEQIVGEYNSRSKTRYRAHFKTRANAFRDSWLYLREKSEEQGGGITKQLEHDIWPRFSSGQDKTLESLLGGQEANRVAGLRLLTRLTDSVDHLRVEVYGTALSHADGNQEDMLTVELQRTVFRVPMSVSLFSSLDDAPRSSNSQREVLLNADMKPFKTDFQAPRKAMNSIMQSLLSTKHLKGEEERRSARKCPHLLQEVLCSEGNITKLLGKMMQDPDYREIALVGRLFQQDTLADKESYTFKIQGVGIKDGSSEFTHLSHKSFVVNIPYGRDQVPTLDILSEGV